MSVVCYDRVDKSFTCKYLNVSLIIAHDLPYNESQKPITNTKINTKQTHIHNQTLNSQVTASHSILNRIHTAQDTIIEKMKNYINSNPISSIKSKSNGSRDDPFHTNTNINTIEPYEIQ